MADIVYQDRWGEIIDRPEVQVVEIRWFDSTSAMTRDDFQEWLTTFAKHVEQLRRPGILVDSTSFGMSRANMDADWRDTNIIPTYNAAGVAKFAFHMPAGMPAIGSPPEREGPGRFPTGYFGTREDAMAWLAS